jgi:hypothetical protein
VNETLQRSIDRYLDDNKISRKMETLISYSIKDLQKIQLDLLRFAQKEVGNKLGEVEAQKRVEVFNKYLEGFTKQSVSLPSVAKSSRGAAIIRDPERGEYLTLGKYLETKPGINQIDDTFLRPMSDLIKRFNYRPQDIPKEVKDLQRLVKDFWVRSRPAEEHGVGVGMEEAAKEVVHQAKRSFDVVSNFLKETKGARSNRALGAIAELKSQFIENYDQALREAIRSTDERIMKEEVVSGKRQLSPELERRYRDDLSKLQGKGARYELFPKEVVEVLRQQAQNIAKKVDAIPADRLEQELNQASRREQELFGKDAYQNRAWQRALEEFSSYRPIDFYKMLNRAASYSKDSVNELEKIRNSLSSAGRIQNESYFQELLAQQFKKVFDPIKEKVPEEHEAMQKHEYYGRNKVITIQPKIPGMDAGPSSYGVPVDLQALRRFIVQRNLDMEELFEKEYLRGTEEAMRKLGPSISRLATVGLNEASAAGKRDFGAQFMESFFKGKRLQPFASYDPRHTEAFGYSINPARPTGAAWDSLAGPEFNAVRSRTAHGLIKTGQFGPYGTGINATTVLKDISAGYEDLYEIGSRIQELATFKFKKLVVPHLKGSEEELKKNVIKYLQEVGHDIFGAPIKVEELADQTFVKDIVKRWTQSPQGPLEENIVELLNAYLGHEARKLSTGQVLKGVSATIFGKLGPEVADSVREKAKKGLFPKIQFTDIGNLKDVPKSFEELLTEILQARQDLDSTQVSRALDSIKGTQNLIMMYSDHLRKMKIHPIEYGTGKIMGEDAASLEDRREKIGSLLGINFSSKEALQRSTNVQEQLSMLEADMNKIRRAYQQTVGGSLTKDVPVDLRILASGIGKKSRMIGGNLAEIIANNIIGNLRSKPLADETLVEQIKRSPLAKVVVDDIASGVEARNFAEMYKGALGLKGKYGEEFIYEQDGKLEKAVAGAMHIMVMKEPKGWLPKGASELAAGMSKMTIDPHGWFGLKKLFQPGGALEKEFTQRAFPEARQAGAFLSALRSFSKLREEELKKASSLKQMPTVGAQELVDERAPGYIAPLKRKATITDLGQTIFDPFKYGPAMVLELPEPSEAMKADIQQQVEEGIKKGQQVMPVKKRIEIPEISAREYVTSDTGEILPSVTSRYLSELLESVRRFHLLQTDKDEPQLNELKRDFINLAVEGFYNKIHPVRNVDFKKQMVSNLEEQVFDLVGDMPMPTFSGKSSLITDPDDVTKTMFPTLYTRLSEENQKALEEDLKKGISIKEAYDKYFAVMEESVSNLNFRARFLRNLIAGPVVYTRDPALIGKKARVDVTEDKSANYESVDLVTNQMLPKIITNFKQYETEVDRAGQVSGIRSKSILDTQYDEIRRNLKEYYNELSNMIFGRGVISDVVLKKKVPALYLTAQQRPYDPSEHLKKGIEKLEKFSGEIPQATMMLGKMQEALRDVEEFKVKHPSQWIRPGDVRIGERDLRELQKSGQATPELQSQVDDVYALVNRQPTTDEFSYKSMRLVVEDMLKDLSGIAQVPGLPIGDYPVMSAMEETREALDALRETKVRMIERELERSGGKVTKAVRGLQQDIDEIDSASKDLQPMYHMASTHLDFDGDMVAVHAATVKEANDELKKIHEKQIQEYGTGRRLIHESLSSVPASKISMGSKGSELLQGELPESLKRTAAPVWKEMDIVSDITKQAKKNLLDIHETDPGNIAEDALKHFVHKVDMGQGYEAFNRIGFLYRGASAKGLGIPPKLHEEYNILLGEFLRDIIQKVIGGKHGSAGSDMSPIVQQAFFTGNIDSLMEILKSSADVTEESLTKYRSKFLRPMGIDQLREEAESYGISSRGKGREDLIQEIIKKTSFRSMLENVFDQMRRMTVSNIKELYKVGLAGDATLSKKGSLGLAKLLAGKEGYEGETLQTLGKRTKFKFDGGDFTAYVDKEDVTDKVMSEMKKQLGNISKKEAAFQIAAFGEGIQKVRKGLAGNIKESIIEPGLTTASLYRGLQPMYKLKSSGGADLAVSSYTKRSDAPNEFTPGGPALSYAEVLDYVLRNKPGKDVAVGSALGTFSDPATQKAYNFIAPSIKAYEEFEEAHNRVMSVMNRHVYQLEGLLNQVQSFGKETAGFLGEASRAGQRVVYDKDTGQVYIDSAIKSSFQERLRDFSLARNKDEREQAAEKLTRAMDEAHKALRVGAAYKTFDVGQGVNARALRSTVDRLSQSSLYSLLVDSLIEKILYTREFGPTVKKWLTQI